jgi:hypothetical protein
LTFYWQIIATRRYLDQVSELSIPIQELIGKAWIKVASHEDPTAIGNTDTCGEHTSPNVVVIFPGLEFEFIYMVDQTEKTIRLINCEKLSFLDYGQIDYP